MTNQEKINYIIEKGPPFEDYFEPKDIPYFDDWLNQAQTDVNGSEAQLLIFFYEDEFGEDYD